MNTILALLIFFLPNILIGSENIKNKLDILLRKKLQRESLSFIFYKNNSLPNKPIKKEYIKLNNKLKKATKLERKMIKKVYKNDKEMIIYALRDSDKDGILDYRVSDYQGKLYEGDIDIDGDGIRNIYDIEPYNPNIGGIDINRDGIPDRNFLDKNKNKIPDHLDWELDSSKSSLMKKIQKELFLNHKIILVEKNKQFNEKTVKSLYNAIIKVYKNLFYSDKNVLSTLRTIAIEDISLLHSSIEEGKYDQAMVNSSNQSLTIYSKGAELAPILQFGLFVHELAHSYQMSLDFESLKKEQVKTNYPSTKFYDEIKAFGWKAEVIPILEEWKFNLFIPMYTLYGPDEYFHNEPIEDWQPWLDEIYEEVGDNYLQDSRVTGYNIVGYYSMSNSWEWHADNAVAYVLVEIEKKIHEICPKSSDKMIKNLRNNIIPKYWPDFYYPNIIGSDIYQYFKDKMPISSKNLIELINEYFVLCSN